ncbi:hypothetical protein NE237_027551 [Protea cynaroides]|uniref:Uncharacterized protein n=1 Tax=Protea cynaroides TaxID=273540 RepID=A0A9Q0JS17_9MAGN|nr:hypothetical protein NE237_027551 [Protea cynaroides]
MSQLIKIAECTFRLQHVSANEMSPANIPSSTIFSYKNGFNDTAWSPTGKLFNGCLCRLQYKIELSYKGLWKIQLRRPLDQNRSKFLLIQGVVHWPKTEQWLSKGMRRYTQSLKTMDSLRYLVTNGVFFTLMTPLAKAQLK